MLEPHERPPGLPAHRGRRARHAARHLSLRRNGASACQTRQWRRWGVGCSSWSGGSSDSRTSTGSPARSGASAGSAPTRSPATCSGGWSPVGPEQQRLPRQRRPPLPRRRQPPRVRHARVRLDPRPGHPRQGRRADPRAAPRPGRAAPPRGGHPRRHLPLQEQHRLRRQQLRLPRELPDQPARRLRPLRRGAHPVLRVAADLRRRRQGAADRPRRDVLHRPAGRAHLGGRVAAPPPAAARSSTPATSRTPTPSATAGST